MKAFISISLILFISLSCKKKINSCETGSCDVNRKTIMTASNWTGAVGYNNELRRWTVNVSIPNTIDGVRTCIICADIPDRLKKIGLMVTFSGELKESCNNPAPQIGGQEIYFVVPTELR